MNKKILIYLIVVILIIGIVGFVIYKTNSSKEDNSNTKNVTTSVNKQSDENNNPVTYSGNKILVVYYSAQSHTKAVAEKVASNLDADIFIIRPEKEYTSDDLDWTDSNSRVSKEHEDESLQDVKLITTKVDNWEKYDTILVGFPIWWGVSAWPVTTFVKANDFTGKTVIPFCTSASSGLGQSGELLKEATGTGNWLEGKRFSSNASDSDITAWTDSLK